MGTSLIQQASVRAYLMSYVGTQFVLSRERFTRRYPHAWVVWEPGAWNFPPAQLKETLTPSRPTQPAEGDALCFELAVPVGAQVHAGRREGNALVINDATFSREQLVLQRTGAEAWQVVLAQGARTCELDGAALTESPVPLGPQATLVAGDVKLRFYSPPAFLERLEEEERRGRF